MSHPVLALGTAALTAAGCVWYLPAVADLRAGEDRPRSVRTAAAACVVCWVGLALAGGVLPVVPDWRPAAGFALTGLVAGAVLRVRAYRHRRGEQRESGRRWAMLDAGPVPRGRRPAARILAGWLLVGLAVAALGALSLLLTAGGPVASRLGGAAAGAGVVSTAFLLIGLANARRHRP
ncbi:hypothetical protein [Kitasatospora sp. NPDC005751]|uniref:hypothetical protein n=1 Tax=Kitasatospora sp. NPDC005751 TaxID=3157064 RepID=UPI0033D4F200